MKSFLEIYDLASATTRTILTHDAVIEAPNWDPSGTSLLVNGGGKLYRVPFDAPRLIQVPTGFAEKLNNDHGISPDGKQIVISNHRGRGSEIFLLPAEGGEPVEISPDSPSWFHGWSPDGKTITYVAARGDKKAIDVYTMTLGQPETRLTMGEGHCDGPDFSADGARIYYNCDRDGHAQIWVMNADGSNQRKLFADDHVNWFPHPSPDGQTLVYLAYPPGTTGHPANLPVALVLMDTEGNNRRRILEFNGGQGTINVPSWSPDGRQFAYVRYQPDLQETAMPITAKDLVAAANAVVPRITTAEAQAKMAQGALLLDIRDAPELEANGRAAGSHHIPRGMLEFRADPTSPYHDAKLQPDRPVILHCASGGRAALAGKLLQDLGYTQVFNLGGFKNWKEAGGAVEEPLDKGM